MDLTTRPLSQGYLRLCHDVCIVTQTNTKRFRGTARLSTIDPVRGRGNGNVSVAGFCFATAIFVSQNFILGLGDECVVIGVAWKRAPRRFELNLNRSEPD